MPIAVVTPATAFPLDLSDADDHLRGLYADDDAHLQRLVRAAAAYIEGDLGVAMLDTVYDETFASWDKWQKFRLGRSPLESVTSVKYYDDDDSEQTWDSANYLTTGVPEIEVAPDISLPSVSTRQYPWTVRYTAGYGTSASDVPHTLQQAMRLIIEDMDRFRGNFMTGTVTAPVAIGVRRLLALNDPGVL